MTDFPLRVYREGLDAGELWFQRCGECGRAVFYPRVLCPFCGATSLAWEVSEGEGVIYSTTSIPLREGPSRGVSIVDLAEGFRMLSRVEGVAAEDVEIGMAVTFATLPTDDGPLAVFRSAEGSS